MGVAIRNLNDVAKRFRTSGEYGVTVLKSKGYVKVRIGYTGLPDNYMKWTQDREDWAKQIAINNDLKFELEHAKDCNGVLTSLRVYMS